MGRFYDFNLDFTNPFYTFSLVDNRVLTGYRGVNLIPYTLFWDYTVITINGNEPSPGSSIDIETQVTYTAQYTRVRGSFLQSGFTNLAGIYGGLVYGAGDIALDISNISFQFGLAGYGVGQINRFTFSFSDE